VAKKTQNVESFIGQHEKLSRAAQKREAARENENIVVHQG
jgi:hypothetical protein